MVNQPLESTTQHLPFMTEPKLIHIHTVKLSMLIL